MFNFAFVLKKSKTNELDYSRALVSRRVQDATKLLKSDLGDSRKPGFPVSSKLKTGMIFCQSFAVIIFFTSKIISSGVSSLTSAKYYRTILKSFTVEMMSYCFHPNKKAESLRLNVQLLELESRYFCFTLISNWIKAIYMRVICLNYLWRKW